MIYFTLLLENNRVSGRGILYWCIFDFGLCIYTTAAAAFAFTLLFRNWICLEPEKYGDMLLAVCTSTSFACSAILSPTLGAVADVLGTRIRFLTVCVCLIFAGCLLLSLPGKGDILPAIVIFIVANASLDISYVFYNALLPQIAGQQKIGFVSNLGAVFNFAGGLFSLALSYLILNFAGMSGHAGLRVIIVVSGLLVAVFALPVIFGIKEVKKQIAPAFVKVVSDAFLHILDTLKNFRRFQDLFVFWIAYLLFCASTITAYIFISVYAKSVWGIPEQDLPLMLGAIFIAGALSAGLCGVVVDKSGPKPLLMIFVLGWCLCLISISIANSKFLFFALVIVGGFFVGPLFALSRAITAMLSPQEKITEFFGFQSLVAKVSYMTGPLIYGTVSMLTGRLPFAIVSLGVLAFLGFLVLFVVNIKRGVQAVRQS